MEQGVNEVIVNELSIQLKNLGLIDECINDVRNALVDVSKVYKEEQKSIDEAYQRGLTDAWMATRKIFGSNIDGGYCMEQIREILGKRSLFCPTDVIRQCTINEVIEKLKAYEEKADKDVKRGDVVRSKVNGLTYIVTIASEGGYVLLGSDGNFATSCITNLFEKTGRHFDIDKILEEMKE